MPHWICKLPDDAIMALMLVGVAGATDAALLAMRYAVRFQLPSERAGPPFGG